MTVADCVSRIAKIISGAHAIWIDCEPEPRQRVYFANHTSNLDFAVIWSVLPPEVRALTRPAAARDYWEGGAVRRYLAKNVFNAILIERHHVTRDNHPILQMLEAMGDRDSLVIFPEGARFTDDEIHPFKSGLYHLCRRRPDLELVPVYLENLNRVLPKGEFLLVPLIATVLFGPPMRMEKNESKTAFLERAREAICRLRRTWRES